MGTWAVLAAVLDMRLSHTLGLTRTCCSAW